MSRVEKQAAGGATQYLFAYGTLRRACVSPVHDLLNAHTAWEGPARYQGRMYLVDFYPGVTPSPRANDVVRGDLYRLLNPAQLLPQLDEYEGSGPGPACEFDRVKASVLLEIGRQREAWIYLFKLETAGLRRIEDGDFVRHTGV